jgi:hypothetical protein
MGRILLFLLAAWIVLSIIGLVIHGLFYLFILGIVLVAVTAGWGWLKRSS